MVRGIRIKDLVRHVLITGMPGSGKTTVVIAILLVLAALGIPFILLEPGNKNDYRRLKRLKHHPDPTVRRLARKLRVYNLSDDRLSPLRLNPLGAASHLPLPLAQIETILDCFKAAMPMGGPLSFILGEVLERIYEEYPDPSHPPVIADLYRILLEVVAEKGYTSDTSSDIVAAARGRVGDLARRTIGRVLQCRQNVPSIQELVSGHSVIEFGPLPKDLSCLLGLFVLQAIANHVASTPWTGDGIRLVVLIEEAHNIVGCSREAVPSESNADPQAYAAEHVCRMLAEFRALGVGIIIIDQLPSAVAPEVIKNTGTKLAFKQQDAEERRAIGSAMSFGPTEMAEIARFVTGDAYLLREGDFEPRRIRTRDLDTELGLPATRVGDDILPFLEEDQWYIDDATARITAEMRQLREEMDRFDATLMHLTKAAAEAVAERSFILARTSGTRRRGRLSELAKRARALRRELESAFGKFRRDAYWPLIGTGVGAHVVPNSVKGLRDDAISRFESVIEPGVRACGAVLSRLIRNCETPRL